MSKILFISTRYPFPIFGGDKLRSFGILKFLSKKNQVDVYENQKVNVEWNNNKYGNYVYIENLING